jgi:SAM-dependent methyltransferase
VPETSSTVRPSPVERAQGRANDDLWIKGDHVRAYASRNLRPAEVMILVRYREHLSGRVLELGCGAGRLTGYLSQMSSNARGIDISPRMVAYCRERYPNAQYDEADLRTATAQSAATYDAIVAAYNILDVLTDAERSTVLDQVRDHLCPGGILIMSSHNRASQPNGIQATLRRGGVRGYVSGVADLPRWWLNRRRLVPFQHEETDYAVRNDISQDFGALHYYITRDAQERQFNKHGFRLLECLDLEGRPVNAGQPSSLCSELHYVAQVAGPGPG